MSTRTVLANVVTLAFLFGGFAVLGAWSGSVSWPHVAVLTLVMFVGLLLIERFFGEGDRTSSDS